MAHPAVRVERLLAALTAAVIVGWAYQIWVRAPILEPWTLNQAYLLGAVGAAVLGGVLAVLVRHPVDMFVAGASGIVAGHAWALHQMSDVRISFPGALSQTVLELRYHHVVQLALLATAWALVRAAARYQRLEPEHPRHDV